jgi:hypothetical protein
LSIAPKSSQLSGSRKSLGKVPNSYLKAFTSSEIGDGITCYRDSG